MFDWQSLLDEAALRNVLPGEYARFAGPVLDGLTVFLDGLPGAWQAEIMRQQSLLPASAGISERLVSFAHCCPVLHKLGQVLARDQRLAPELRLHLRKLESLEPSVPIEAIKHTVVEELGPLEQLGIRLAPSAIAEASVAVVVPFVGSGTADGVLKVLKPGIEERLAVELDLLTRVGSHLDERCEELRIPRLNYEDLFVQIRDKLRHEVRLDGEQRNLAEAAAIYAAEPQVHIPALLEYCTPRITAMERVFGVKVTDHCLDDPHDRRRLVGTVVRAMIAQPIFSGARQAMFHGDPHAGNLFLTRENRLAILDWSLVGSLGDGVRVAILQILRSAATLNVGRIVAELEGLGEGARPNPPALVAVVNASLKRIRQGMLPGLSWLVGLLDDAVATARLRVASDLLLLRKSLHTLEGLIADIGGDARQVDRILLVEFLHRFACEWPLRYVAPPRFRAFATRLSNLDLFETLLDCPSAAARFWIGQGLDVLDVFSASGKLAALDSLSRA